MDYYTIDNRMVPVESGQEAHPGLERRPGSMMIRAWGTAPAAGLHVNLAVEDPAQFTAAAFRQALMLRGIKVTGSAESRHKFPSGTGEFANERAKPLKLVPVALNTVSADPAGRHVLAAHISVPVAEDITLTNKVSQNLHAELLLRLLGKICGTDGSFEEGTRVVRQFMVDAGVADNDFFLYDGSGMSPDDKVAPRAYTRLLSYASRQSWGAAFKATLPVAGVDGTLEDRLRNTAATGLIEAKTGTLEHDHALSGYATTLRGEYLAFAIFCNNDAEHGPGASAPVDAIAKAMIETLGGKRGPVSARK